MIKSTIEKQLISFCNGARLITREELKHFIRGDGKVSDHTLSQYTQDVDFIRTGQGGTKRYFISEVARRMCEMSE